MKVRFENGIFKLRFLNISNGVRVVVNAVSVCSELIPDK